MDYKACAVFDENVPFSAIGRRSCEESAPIRRIGKIVRLLFLRRQMNRHFVEIMTGFHKGLRYNRMRKGQRTQIGDCHLGLDRQGRGVNDFGCMRPDDMDAEQPVGFLISDYLDFAGDFAFGVGFSQSPHRE